MKYTSLFVILLIAVAFGASEQLQNEARAMDAVDSALDVLKGLKQSNIDAQKLADATNKTQEAAMKLEIDELKNVADSNKEAGDAATKHRKYLAERIDVTNQYLRWIVARRAELIRKRKELAEQRCVSNANFIVALKEHVEGLHIIRLLKADVIKEIQAKKKGAKSLMQMTDASKKLAGFAHLFNQKAMDDFIQLGRSTKVDKEKLQHDKNSDDNNKGGIKLKKAAYKSNDRSVATRFVDMINRLEKHIVESIKNMEENEIQAAVDLSDWLSHTEQELAYLVKEQKTNINNVDKLSINIVSAKAREDRIWQIYFESASTYNDSLKARLKRRAVFMQEKARRLEENLVLDGIVKIFIKQVAKLAKKTREGASKKKAMFAQTHQEKVEGKIRHSIRSAQALF